MLDLAKAFLLIPMYLTVYMCLGTLVLRTIRACFSFSLAVLTGFFAYHILFSLVALPCILTVQTLTTLMWLWLPLLIILLIFSVLSCRRFLVHEISKFIINVQTMLKSKPSSILLPVISVAAVLFVLYISTCAYYVGWDTAFYIRTTLHAVVNDSMYTLDAASGQMASVLSLRYALSPFYMNSAIFCRLTGVHPLLVENLTDGAICVILAFVVIYRIGLMVFKDNPAKACAVMIAAAIIHISHASLFSTSDFLLLRSYEAKAYCSNIVLPFIGYMLVQLWKSPHQKALWVLLFLGSAASVPVSMSSLLTVPILITGGALVWLFHKNWRALKHVILCLIPNLAFLSVYLLEYISILTIHIS